MPPETRYARSGDIHIAYQVVGDGPFDLLFVPGFVSHLEANWDDPNIAAMLGRLARFSRLILFDKRGTGLSDRGSLNFTLEQRMEDVRAVLDAVGSQRAALFGISEGGPMSALYAATYPERTSALVIYGSYARRSWAPDHPFGMTDPGEPRSDRQRLRAAEAGRAGRSAAGIPCTGPPTSDNIPSRPAPGGRDTR